MIEYDKVNRGDILIITGPGAPGYAEIGDLVRVIGVTLNSVRVEDKYGKPCEFVFNCGAARLEETKWKKDFPSCSQVSKPADEFDGLAVTNRHQLTGAE